MPDMRKQQAIWSKEHQGNITIPSLASHKPSDGVVFFISYLKRIRVVPAGKALDIGCGKGRNTLYFAKQGYEVYGIDYIPAAINHTKQRARTLNIQNRIKLFTAAIDQRWPFPDNFFDLAIDNYSSIDIETKKGRETYKKELVRTLKPGGWALVAVVSTDDELEQTMKKGREPNSTIWPNGKFQKNYTQKELREFYKEFEILEIKEMKKPAFKLGKNYMATNYWMILRNPSSR